MKKWRRRGIITAAFIFVGSCAGGPSPNPSQRECEQLRDHLIDLRMTDVTVDQAQHRQALELAMGTTFVTQCAESMSGADVRCAMSARAATELAACTE